MYANSKNISAGGYGLVVKIFIENIDLSSVNCKCPCRYECSIAATEQINDDQGDAHVLPLSILWRYQISGFDTTEGSKWLFCIAMSVRFNDNCLPKATSSRRHAGRITDYGVRSRSVFIFSNFPLACATAFRVEAEWKGAAAGGVGRIETDVAGVTVAGRRCATTRGSVAVAVRRTP